MRSVHCPPDPLGAVHKLHMGRGLPNLLQYYHRGGGVYLDPKFVFRDKWTAPYFAASFNFLWYPTHKTVLY